MSKIDQIQKEISDLDTEINNNKTFIKQATDDLKNVQTGLENLKKNKSSNVMKNKDTREKIYKLEEEIKQLKENLYLRRESNHWLQEVKYNKLLEDLCQAKLEERDRIYSSLIKDNEPIESLVQLLLNNPQTDDRYKKFMPMQYFKNSWKVKFNEKDNNSPIIVQYPCWSDEHEGIIQQVDKRTGDVYDQNNKCLFNMKKVLPSQLKFEFSIGWTCYDN